MTGLEALAHLAFAWGVLLAAGLLAAGVVALAALGAWLRDSVRMGPP